MGRKSMEVLWQVLSSPYGRLPKTPCSSFTPSCKRIPRSVELIPSHPIIGCVISFKEVYRLSELRKELKALLIEEYPHLSRFQRVRAIRNLEKRMDQSAKELAQKVRETFGEIK